MKQIQNDLQYKKTQVIVIRQTILQIKQKLTSYEHKVELQVICFPNRDQIFPIGLQPTTVVIVD